MSSQSFAYATTRPASHTALSAMERSHLVGSASSPGRARAFAMRSSACEIPRSPESTMLRALDILDPCVKSTFFHDNERRRHQIAVQVKVDAVTALFLASWIADVVRFAQPRIKER